MKPLLAPTWDEPGYRPVLFGRSMFRDIDRSAAVFAAHRQPLQCPQGNQRIGAAIPIC